LSLGGWDTEQVKVLVEVRADRPPLQLHSFDINMDHVYLDRAQLLARMTTLRSLAPLWFSVDALHLLVHAMPDLRTLYLTVAIVCESEWSVVQEGVAACRQLTDCLS